MCIGGALELKESCIDTVKTMLPVDEHTTMPNRMLDIPIENPTLGKGSLVDAVVAAVGREQGEG